MSPAFDIAIYIGRFQPFLNDHLAQLRHALTLSSRVLLVVEGGHAPSPRHPLDARQRTALIRAALSPQERQRVHLVVKRRDYDHERWSQSLRQQVLSVMSGHPRVVVLREPGGRLPAPQWADRILNVPADENPAPLRELLYQAADPRAELGRQQMLLAPGSLPLLEQWLASPAFAERAQEWRELKRMRAQWDGSPYTPIFTTVDTVVQCAGQILLIRRGRAPGKGLFALPGGFLEAEDTLLESAMRELFEETALDVSVPALRSALQAVQVFDAPDRSQRGRVLTHAFHFRLTMPALPAIRAGDDAADACWMPLAELPAHEQAFHDDHFLILDHFLDIATREVEQPLSLQ